VEFVGVRNDWCSKVEAVHTAQGIDLVAGQIECERRAGPCKTLFYPPPLSVLLTLDASCRKGCVTADAHWSSETSDPAIRGIAKGRRNA
jgi:hypothetical protein